MFDKGRVSPAIKAVPVYIVLTEDIGERGAHFYAYQLLTATKAQSAPQQITQAIESLQCPLGIFAQGAFISAFVAAGVAIGVAIARKV